MSFALLIKKVLAASGQPLTISQIMDALADQGHKNVTLKQVKEELEIALRKSFIQPRQEFQAETTLDSN